jgi:hypothetical protein
LSFSAFNSFEYLKFTEISLKFPTNAKPAYLTSCDANDTGEKSKTIKPVRISFFILKNLSITY